MKLVPRDRKCFLCRLLRLRFGHELPLPDFPGKSYRMIPKSGNRFSEKILRRRKLPYVQHEIETSGERSLVLGGAYQQLSAEQAVAPILRLAGEVKLGGEQAPGLRRDLHV